MCVVNAGEVCKQVLQCIDSMGNCVFPLLYFNILLGQAGWGIAWYINNTIVPELVVERGRTYTFLVYGGAVPADSSNYHPFYITDSVNGGRLLNTPQERTVV